MSDSNGSKWLSDWEALQRQYWDAWSGLAAQGRGDAGPEKGDEDNADRHWAEAVETWWKDAGATGSLGHTLAEQGRWFLDMGEDILRQFTALSRQADTETTEAWQMAVDAWMDQARSNEQWGWWTQPFRRYLALANQISGFKPEDMGILLEPDSEASLVEKLRSWLSLPTFGYTRETQEDVQNLARACLAHQEALAAYKQQMLQVATGTAQRLHARLDEIAAEGAEVTSLRQLFDLWVDAGEDEYAVIVWTDEFRSIYGRLINTMMKVRKGVQKLMERQARLTGWPTRSEMDSAHARIHALRQELRDLKAQLQSDDDNGEMK